MHYCWCAYAPLTCNQYLNEMLLTLSAPKAIVRYLQTMQIQVSQLVTSCLTWNQHCLRFSYIKISKSPITREVDTPNFKHARVYFKQFSSERVKTRTQKIKLKKLGNLTYLWQKHKYCMCTLDNIYISNANEWIHIFIKLYSGTQYNRLFY